jgi:HPt (histidine-containing phosphotransfer) domain-containing protein
MWRQGGGADVLRKPRSVRFSEACDRYRPGQAEGGPERMNEASQRFARLRRRYERSLPEKRTVLARAWQALRAAPDEHRAAILQSIAHRLAGSAPPYGYETLGSAARSLDAMLDDWLKRAPADRESVVVLAELLLPRVTAVLERFAEATASAASSDLS